MTPHWRDIAREVAEQTFLSVREAEAVLLYQELRFPDNGLPKSKEHVYEDVGNELGIEATTVRTYLTRANDKMETAVATAKFVEDPIEYQNTDNPRESLSALLERQQVIQRSVNPVW